MNERIKELEKQCLTYRINGALVDGQLHFDTEKFAELIVRECANLPFKSTGEMTTIGEIAVSEMILKHFGVEE